MVILKKIYSLLGSVILILFSFYFTDKVSHIILNKNSIVKNIKEVSSEYETEPVDAKIEANTIIPGRYGKKVNVEKSYMNMQDFGLFNANFLTYDLVKPKKSLDDNKDKYIISGNKYRRYISLIIEDNTDLKKFLDVNQIKYNLMAKRDTVIDKKNNYIFSELDEEKFIPFTKKTKAPYLCLKDYTDIELCKKYGFYILSPSIVIDDYNINSSLKKIDAGSIILVKELSSDNMYKLLNRLNYKGLSSTFISKIIDEKTD